MGNQQSATKPPERAEMAEKTGVYANRDKLLTEVPTKVFTIANLRTLDLSHNKIATIPRTVGVLAPKLKTLDFAHNKLASLPHEICELHELHTLGLSDNLLTELPDALGALGKLKTLMLARNRFSALPESMCALRSLAHLDASSNKLDRLPAGFGYLEALMAANLSHNQLGALPSNLGGLKRLKELDLRGNAPLVVHGSVPAELLLETPLHRLEVDPEMIGSDGLLLPEAAGGVEALAAYTARRKARIDKEMHAKERGGDISFSQ